ncbi:RHS repeat domain-containing protein [Streptomyces xiangluensis]|uniref:RHS repeat domain-containing protein n=1 Tax=Streptomyces xiangluensis TaxID=2665720 RepID=A0ABV8YXW5_9ACTN
MDLTVTYDAHGAETAWATAGTTTAYQRDDTGRTRRITDPTGLVTELEYDALDNLIRVGRADGREQRCTVRPSGAVARFVDFDGTAVDYTYSSVELPRELRPTPAGAAAPTAPILLDYDGLRRVVRAEGVVHTFRYDSLGRLLEESGPDVVRREYSASGRDQVQHYPDGRRDNSHHDELLRPVSVTLAGAGALPLPAHGVTVGDRLAELSWVGPDRPADVRALGLTTHHDYDAAYRLGAIRHTGPTGAMQHDERALRDPLGIRRLLRTDSPGTDHTLHQVDGLNRIRSTSSGLGGIAPLPSVTAAQADLDAAIADAEAAPYTRRTALTFTPGDLLPVAAPRAAPYTPPATAPTFGAVLEVKNKIRLSSDDIRQIGDFGQVATQLRGELWVMARPGMPTNNLAPAPNMRVFPIPRQPMVVTVPTPVAQQPAESK